MIRFFSLLFCYLLHIKCNFTTYYYSTTTYEEKLKKTSLIKKSYNFVLRTLIYSVLKFVHIQFSSAFYYVTIESLSE
jgi:hypothetical protein